jgi:nucleoside-diphosphate-sugar epimerase
MYNKHIKIIGGGFLSNHLFEYLKNKKINCKIIDRAKCDLSDNKDIKKLNKYIKKDDIIVFIAAKAPAKNISDYDYNLSLCLNFLKIIKKDSFEHFYYISSDAVYSDSKKEINETSLLVPNSIHGYMHLTRELIFAQYFKNKFSIFRPTLLYGLNDPHNGYGPNRFLREIVKKKEVTLFGKGEELRDHIHVSHAAELIGILIVNNFRGTMNICSGKVISFYNFAKQLFRIKNKKTKIVFKKRLMPMPHDGYRAFDNLRLKRKTKNSFDFRNIYENGIKLMHNT